MSAILAFITSRLGLGVIAAVTALWSAYATVGWIQAGARLDDAQARAERLVTELEDVRSDLSTCRLNTSDLRRELSQQNAALADMERRAAEARAERADALARAEALSEDKQALAGALSADRPDTCAAMRDLAEQYREAMQ